MSEPAALARPEIQAQLISEALLAASVGLLVWDDDRRYVAANAAACEILGTTLEELLGQEVGGHTPEGDEAIAAALESGFSTGTTFVDRFDGSGRIAVHFATFTTRTAGMPFMATVIAPVQAPGAAAGA